MKKGKRLNTSGSKEKLKATWDKFMIPLIVTIVGGLIVTVAGGLILNSIIQKDTDPTSTPKDTIRDDDIPSNTTSDDSPSESTTPDDTTIDYDGTLDDGTMLDDDTFDDPASHNINSTSNGTMPKGTSPETIPITSEMIEVLKTLQQISIGSNKDWVDDKLGPPFVQNLVPVTEEGRLPYDIDGSRIGEENIVDEFLECIYLFDIASVRIYFNSSGTSCKAYFITLMKDALGIDIMMPEAYSFIPSSKPLGEFSFTEIGSEPINVCGVVSQGTGRSFYGEHYYFAGNGNYQDFYFTIVDYGMLKSYEDFGWFLSMIQTDIAPHNDSADIYYDSDLLIQQRSALYPNTYGISTLNYKITFSLLYTDVDFDSFRLRG